MNTHTISAYRWCYRFQSVAFTIGALLSDPRLSKRADTWVCPSECCCRLRLKLDDIGMSTQCLMIHKEIGKASAFMDKMGKGPVHEELVGSGGLEVCLRKAKDFFEKLPGEINIRHLLLI